MVRKGEVLLLILVFAVNVVVPIVDKASAFTGPLNAHQETTTIGGITYYLFQTYSADQPGTTLTQSCASLGRVLFGKFVIQLTGMSSIDAGTWTFYYSAWRDTGSQTCHIDVDILIRESSGTVRGPPIATTVARSYDYSNDDFWNLFDECLHNC
jgi:hypothetical protein